jgi:hypothetical protein
MKGAINATTKIATIVVCVMTLLLFSIPVDAMNIEKSYNVQLRIQHMENILRTRAHLIPVQRTRVIRRLNKLQTKLFTIIPQPRTKSSTSINFKTETKIPQLTSGLSQSNSVVPEAVIPEIVLPQTSRPAPSESTASPTVTQAPAAAEIEAIEYTEVFNGYGDVVISENGSNVHLDPMHASESTETHAALVVSEQTLSGNYSVSFIINNESQSRTGSPPNPWEVGWFVFGYKPNGIFKYLILKPDGYGIELGESLGNDIQNFLWTSNVGDDQFSIGQSYSVKLEVNNDDVILTIDGSERFRYSISEKDTLDTDGLFGFYSEDAEVAFSKISID